MRPEIEFLNPNVLSRTAVEDAVASATSDYVSPADLEGIVHIHTRLEDPLDCRMLAMGLAVELLTKGLMVASDTGNEYFYDDPETPLRVTIGRILSDRVGWPLTSPGRPLPGDIVWFENTPAGTEIATVVLAREGWFPDPERPGKWIRRTTP
jgi:hypothetical protein